MLFGITLIFLIKKEEEKKIDDILKEIEKTSSVIEYNLQPKNCKSFKFKDKSYILYYTYDSIDVEVDYSLEKDRILSLTKTIIKHSNTSSDYQE